ncbi:MAG: hypothetical protein ACXW3O_08640 [Brevundimonas sp.]
MAFSTGLIMAATLLTAGGGLQDTTCAAPVVPVVERPVKPTRPATPSCVDEARSRHNCSNRIIAAYNAEMERYGQSFTAHVAEINAYTRTLAAYVEAAAAYAQCEQRIVMPSMLIEG